MNAAAAKSKSTSKTKAKAKGKKRYPLKISDLIKQARELEKQAAKLLQALRKCREIGGNNALGGDQTTIKGPR